MVICFESRQNSGQDQPHIRLDATDPHDHIHHLRLCLVEKGSLIPPAGPIPAYRAGPAAGILLPGACADQRSLHSGPLEGGEQRAGGHIAPGGRTVLLLAGSKHPLRRIAPQDLSNSELLT